MAFLPITEKEMAVLGWERPDFVFVTGDAYVDHPSFGVAIISRVLEAQGYRVAVLSQPDWRDKRNFRRFGAPRLGFLVTSGNIDSMVAHYTAAKRKRSEDAIFPRRKGGVTARPRCDRLFENPQGALSRPSHPARRSGGFPAPLRPL